MVSSGPSAGRRELNLLPVLSSQESQRRRRRQSRSRTYRVFAAPHQGCADSVTARRHERRRVLNRRHRGAHTGWGIAVSNERNRRDPNPLRRQRRSRRSREDGAAMPAAAVGFSGSTRPILTGPTDAHHRDRDITPEIAARGGGRPRRSGPVEGDEDAASISHGGRLAWPLPPARRCIQCAGSKGAECSWYCPRRIPRTRAQ